MAHQDTGAVDVPVTHTVDSAAAALRGLAGEIANEEPLETPEEPEQIEQPIEVADEIDEPEGDELELDVEEGDEGDEPEIDAPIIEAPISLNNDEREAFANAPPEVQEAWAASENRRNEQVQEATTRAAKREAEARTLAEVAAKESLAGERMEWLQENFSPQPPDPRLAQTDPMAYNAQVAQYDAAKRIFDAEVGKLDSERAQAETEYQQEFWKQRDTQLSAMPEFDEGNRKDSIDKVVAIAQEYGIPGERIQNDAEASDLKILLDLAVAREKAAKYDALVKKSKERKRDPKGKFRSQKPGTGQPDYGTRKQVVTQAKQNLAQSGSRADAQAAIKALIT